MNMEERTNTIIKKLAMAGDCLEVEQIVSRSIEDIRKEQLDRDVIAEYTIRLKDDLKKLRPDQFDYLYWCNIRCAILYLKKRMANLIDNE